MRVAFWRSYSDMDKRWAGMVPLSFKSLVAHARFSGIDIEPIYCRSPDEMFLAKADVYCLSSTTPTWAATQRLIDRLSGRFVIVGGPHITCLPKSLPVGCVGVCGEGDEAFASILADIDMAKEYVETFGKLIIKTAKRLKLEDCHHLPAVAETSNNNLMAVTSRGCPFKCWFCCAWKCWSKDNEPVVTRFSARHVAEEVTNYYQDRPKGNITFHDLNFATVPNWLDELADRLEPYVNKRFTINTCSFSAAYARHEILKPLKRLGIKVLGIGMETAGPKLYRKLKPHLKLEKNLELIELAKEYGFQIGASFIVGTPGETPEDLAATVEFISKHKGPHFKQNGLFMFEPYPGSKAWDELEAAGRVSSDMDWEKMTIGANPRDHEALWFNDAMTYAEGVKWREKISKASRL